VIARPGGFLSVGDTLPSVTTVLDGLSGYEFEDAVASLFRALEYEDVSVAARVADEGRDITMLDGETAYVIECKHTDTVSRPVVQKLHSAVATYDHDGPKRGLVVTSGRFTEPAEEYAERLEVTDDPHPVELVDGRRLRELGEKVGMDLYNGRIEVVGEATLPVGAPERVLTDVFENVENAPSRTALPAPDVDVRYRPVVDVQAFTRATFETGAGVIHRIDRRDRLVIEADRDGPRVGPTEVADLVDVQPRPLSAVRTEYDGEADRFGRSEAEYREWAIERLCDSLETTVTYTGDNNVTYQTECRPSADDVDIRSVQPLYLPRVDASVDLGEYTHAYEYDAAGAHHATRTDDVRRCVHCETAGADAGRYTYCENCGSISCATHTKTERVTGEPVCTGCAVTESFLYSETYFYDEENLEAFREEYEAMPFYRKAAENPALSVGVVAAVLLVALLVGVALF
jgi:restriction endonuclease Mrr